MRFFFFAQKSFINLDQVAEIYDMPERDEVQITFVSGKTRIFLRDNDIRNLLNTLKSQAARF